jgi:excisionase family DNA binding protein
MALSSKSVVEGAGRGDEGGGAVTDRPGPEHPAIQWMRQVARLFPIGSAVTVPVELIQEWLDADGHLPGHMEVRDYTLAEVAEKVGRKYPTVFGWVKQGQLEGYQFMGREWRVTPAALEAFLRRQRGNKSPSCLEQGSPDRVSDLSSWRKIRAGQRANPVLSNQGGAL